MSEATEDPAPSKVRERLLRDHERILRKLIDVESLATVVSSGNSGAIGLLRERARELYEILCEHLDLEDRILAPALRETPGFGEIREQRLLAHHAEQRETLREALAELSRDLAPGRVAERVLALVEDVRADVHHENEALLSPNLLKDDPIDVSFTG